MTTRAPALDPQALEAIRSLDEDGTLVIELIDLFRSETPGRVRAVHDAWQRGDTGAMLREAHALKSSTAQMGALRMSELCRQIERHGRDGQIAEAGPDVAELVGAADEADAALRAARESGR
jgi:HPt (histidine-containing phosphotransfer) domain-containing protein